MSCFAYSRLSGKPLDHYFIVPALLPATSWFTLHDIAFRWIGFFLYCSVVLLSLFVFLIFSRLATMFNKSESESESNRKQSNQTICNKYRNLTNRHNTQAFKQQVRAYVLTLSWLSSSAVSARLSVRWRWRASTLWRDSDAGRLRGRDTCALPL